MWHSTARAKEKEQRRDRQQQQELLKGACPAGPARACGSSSHAKGLEAHSAAWAEGTGDSMARHGWDDVRAGRAMSLKGDCLQQALSQGCAPHGSRPQPHL